MPALPQHHRLSGSSTSLQVRDQAQQLARLGGDLLAVRQVAGLVVGHHLRRGMVGGRLNADLNEPLVDVLDLLVPEGGAVAIGRVVGEQLVVVLEVGAAAAGVGDDGVELVRRELLKLLAGELLGQFPFAVVGVERAAAELLGRA